MLNNINYLWEISIEEIPLGFQVAVDEAIKTYPDGKIATTLEVSSNAASEHIHYFDPISYRKRCIDDFIKTSQEARLTFYSDQDFKTKMNKLLLLDARLYSCLLIWLDNTLQNDAFDPRNFNNSLESTYDYFNVENHVSPTSKEFIILKKIDELRLFQL
ncbi:hypothetical protein BMT55_00065 [Listeria newyorkensis]|uniref:Uncharacterized protein n=1 Tax=Listeria newyorkensis TaxID=1497681 RepID=A0ABX4XRH7_9LIST|nr:hypothetical protein [Listeria newyorkensis]PNP94787.1 hypothetical protein BMT55_00065 [Listeria newyorkensis]